MNWRDKKVLITGGAGFIGSHLLDKLLELGADVEVIDITPNLENIKHLENSITFVNKDISKNNFTLAETFDFIFHLAAYTSPSISEQESDLAFKYNVMGTYNVLKSAVGMKNIKKIVFPSTALLYGEPKYLPIDEKHPIKIEEIYRVSKKLGEDMCATFTREYNLPIVFLRLFNAFGPRQNTDFLIPKVILQAVKDKAVEIWTDKPTRDFTFVNDTVEALIKAAETDFVGGPINIGSGREIKIIDIVKQIVNKFNATLNVSNKNIPGSMRLCCDNTMAKTILGWEPKVNFEEGLDLTIEWFKNNSR